VSPGLRLKLPATSANLGPGFDTLALALALYLDIEAHPSSGAGFSIHATGRNAEICSRVDGNLLLSVYRQTVRTHSGRQAPPLTLTMHNGIPLGMGCGSSAASRLAGVALANHFGDLGWAPNRILDEASQLEGHPDNAAACWMGGFVASASGDQAAAQPGLTSTPAPPIAALSIAPPVAWHAMVVLPRLPLATTESRAILPHSYSRHDIVVNLQRVALLTAAFAAGRGDLLAAATRDSMHQPYRGTVCPLLPALLPLSGHDGVLSVTLSGAGPSVLLLLECQARAPKVEQLVRTSAAAAGTPIEEILCCALGESAASSLVSKKATGGCLQLSC
jgi:homoserine kinase